MAVFRAKMARSVAINIFCIYISSMLNQSLYNAKVSSKACNMERRSEIICPCVYLGSKFNQDFYERRMTFTWCQVKRSESIRVSAVNYFIQFIFLIKILSSKAKNFNNLISVTLIDFCPVVHLNFLNVFVSFTLFNGFFWVFAWWTFNRKAHYSPLQILIILILLTNLVLLILLNIILKLIVYLFLISFRGILLLILILVSATISSKLIRLLIIIIISNINIILWFLMSSSTLGGSLAFIYLCCSVILRKLKTSRWRLVLRSNLILVFLIIIRLDLQMTLSLRKNCSCRHLLGSLSWSDFLIDFSLVSNT